MFSKRFVLISPYAFYPPLLRVVEIITQTYGLEGHVMAPEEVDVAKIYHPSGKISGCNLNDASSHLLTFHFFPPVKGNAVHYGFERNILKKVLRRLKPDYIWVHDEFTHPTALQILQYYRLNRTPRIIAYVAQNHTPGPHPLFYRRWPFISRTRLKHLFLWPRLDGITACASKSWDCARRLGLPAKVAIAVNYLPVLGREEAASEGVTFSWSQDKNSFVVGFAGKLTEQKGWKVLLAAIEQLPERFKVVIIGDGEQRTELAEWLARPGLQYRSFFNGPLSMERLLATYPCFDVFVLPSITTPHSVEQFGRVLAEAMACEVPVIGSDSGAIPETIEEAGLVVPEGDPGALADAIQELAINQELCHSLKKKGLNRYRKYFSCEAYSRSLATLFGLSAPP
jgi:glycosyltransferase involved in cell wall biosynthesis